jgi:hypothetical protein
MMRMIGGLALGLAGILAAGCGAGLEDDGNDDSAATATRVFALENGDFETPFACVSKPPERSQKFQDTSPGGRMCYTKGSAHKTEGWLLWMDNTGNGAASWAARGRAGGHALHLTGTEPSAQYVGFPARVGRQYRACGYAQAQTWIVGSEVSSIAIYGESASGGIGTPGGLGGEDAGKSRVVRVHPGSNYPNRICSPWTTLAKPYTRVGFAINRWGSAAVPADIYWDDFTLEER